MFGDRYLEKRAAQGIIRSEQDAEPTELEASCIAFLQSLGSTSTSVPACARPPSPTSFANDDSSPVASLLDEDLSDLAKVDPGYDLFEPPPPQDCVFLRRDMGKLHDSLFSLAQENLTDLAKVDPEYDLFEPLPPSDCVFLRRDMQKLQQAVSFERKSRPPLPVDTPKSSTLINTIPYPTPPASVPPPIHTRVFENLDTPTPLPKNAIATKLRNVAVYPVLSRSKSLALSSSSCYLQNNAGLSTSQGVRAGTEAEALESDSYPTPDSSLELKLGH